jgi:hypothetical protein
MNPMASNCIVLPKLHCVKQWLTGIEHIDVHLKTHTQQKTHWQSISPAWYLFPSSSLSISLQMCHMKIVF